MTFNTDYDKLVARGTNFVGIKSTCMWVRYGEFHFYSGTLDGSGAKTTTGGVTAASGMAAMMQ